ncbi:hypothetical protein GCM10020218_000210 [Dactylosporangium vinaceum]|uniref:histidine kinase n=1 Tax=Dactylosporangium vinaceum TaxID=53362 RepID=A0ABV5M904_9ACTN|nr:histidine kinase [Dactylosporangium vinaceum]
MLARLRSFWDEPGPVGAPGRVWRDWVLTGGFLLAVVLEVLSRPDLPDRWFVGAVALLVVPTLLIRRTRPLLAIGVAFGACGVAPFVNGRDLGLNSFGFVLILGYALTRWGSGRQAVIGAGIITAKLLAGWLFGHATWNATLSGFGVLFAVTALGAAVRYRARARARELDQVKLLERERLARDLHDTVAHHVSAMIIRAQAGLATAPFNPDAATDALRLIESEASRALTEMRGIVRVLRTDEPADLTPTPGVADLHRLADRRPTPTAHRQTDPHPQTDPGLAPDTHHPSDRQPTPDTHRPPDLHRQTDPRLAPDTHRSADRQPTPDTHRSADRQPTPDTHRSADRQPTPDTHRPPDLHRQTDPRLAPDMHRQSDRQATPDAHRAGPAVDVDISGDVSDLPAPIGTTLFRLAQESVTNARRHARNATLIQVMVEADAAEVRLRVTDDGDPTPARSSRSGGFGLIGMMERAGMVGGTCSAGPDPVQGWTVTAVLPRA